MSQKAKGLSHVVTGQNVTDGSIDMYVGHIDGPTTAIVQVRTAAGAAVAWDGVVTVGGGKVTVDNSGATDWAATNVIHVIVAA